MLDAAVELAARQQAFAARQVHSTAFAPHHVFGAFRSMCVRIRPIDPSAIGLQHGIGQEQTEHQQNDFCQGVTSCALSETLHQDTPGSQFAQCIHRPSRNFDGNSLFASSPARDGRMDKTGHPPGHSSASPRASARSHFPRPGQDGPSRIPGIVPMRLFSLLCLRPASQLAGTSGIENGWCVPKALCGLHVNRFKDNQ